MKIVKKLSKNVECSLKDIAFGALFVLYNDNRDCSVYMRIKTSDDYLNTNDIYYISMSTGKQYRKNHATIVYPVSTEPLEWSFKNARED